MHGGHNFPCTIMDSETKIKTIHYIEQTYLPMKNIELPDIFEHVLENLRRHRARKPTLAVELSYNFHDHTEKI